jgi:integration host factor subunit alpha
MTKAEIADTVYQRTDLSKKNAADMVDTLFEMIRQSLERGDDIKLPGFGNFTVRQKVERKGRNPKTGEPVQITARKIVKFKPSPFLRERVNKGTGRVIADISSQHIAITGTLESLARDHAIKRIKEVGASFSSTITKKTTLLVVGKDSGKHKLVQAANNKIKTINEGDFLKLLGVSHTRRLPGF